MTKLVIVESPTKAKTIRNYLPKEYKVIASMGHIRDLPQSAKDIPAKYKEHKWSKLGVNVEKNFEPLYLIPKTKKKIVKELKELIKDADELLLATDEDREGESISWHLLEVLKPTIPVKRMVFHEITKEAIQESLTQCRDIDDRLVRAQETRRILDRLVGYTLSPLIWKKIAYGLSAGRVQSMAVRLIVERERERRAFRKGSYWDLKAALDFDSKDFEAKLYSLDGKRLATGKDFDENTGKIPDGKNVLLLGEKEAGELKDKLKNHPWKIAKVEEKPSTRKPSAPFITSTLQQEANRKLGLSARNTMRVAQGLYEKGFITYMRTDSVHLSDQAIQAARTCVADMYGKDYLSPEPRQFKTKSKSAQEAHEAIRPAGAEFKAPKDTGLSDRDLALYDLIWKRTMATQMAEVKQTFVSVDVEVDDAMFRASGKRIDFPGFFRAYVEGSDDPNAAIDNQEVPLPKFKVGDVANCQNIDALGHETQPPARFTEASLVRKLEALGVGRPSTYASIISTVQDRGYVVMTGNALIPTFTAFSVTHLLEVHFPHLVDTSFTAKMEDTLDEIASGNTEWLPYLKNFYSGKEGLDTQVKLQEGQIDPEEARTVTMDGLEVTVRIGRYGAYLEMMKDGEPFKATIPDSVAPADLDSAQVEKIIRLKEEGPQVLGKHPENGEPIFVLEGRYGPYVQLGDMADDKIKPKRVGLPKGVKPEDVNLEQALGLLSLPRTLGEHPETGKRIFSAIGRFGPFICYDQGKDGKDYRSLKAKDGDDPVTVTLERALEILAQPKKGRGRKATALKELGNHPDDDAPVNVYDGPYGHYVKHGKVNAGLPEGKNYEEVTLEEALVWIAEKKGTKKTAKKKAAPKKKKAAKKKKAVKKKAAPKKKAVKKKAVKKEES
jgi:DNA topoisomerase I